MRFPHKAKEFSELAVPVKSEESKEKTQEPLDQFLASWEELIESDLQNELSHIEKRVLEEY